MDPTLERSVQSARNAALAGTHEIEKKLVASLKTEGEIKRRQDDLRAKFLDAIGPFPDKTPLNAKTVGTLKGDGFRVEKVIYESRPEHHVTANFYRPDGKGPFPAVIVIYQP